VSKQESPAANPPQTVNQMQQQQRLAQLSQIYKNPIRQGCSELEELVFSATNGLITEIINLEARMQMKDMEIQRLTKLCDDNKIDLAPKPPNREERRATERADKKNSK